MGKKEVKAKLSKATLNKIVMLLHSKKSAVVYEILQLGAIEDNEARLLKAKELKARLEAIDTTLSIMENLK